MSLPLNSTLVYYLNLKTFHSFFFAAQNLLSFEINDSEVNNGSTTPFSPSTNVVIKCVYHQSLSTPIMSEYVSGTFENLTLSPHDEDKYPYIEYTIPVSEKKDLRIYRCSFNTIYYLEIKLNFSVSSNCK